MDAQSDIDFRRYVEFIQTNPQGLVFGPFSSEVGAFDPGNEYAAFHAAWQALHSRRNPTREWLVEWLATLPGCSSCRSWFRDYLQTNPPRFDDWPAWSWEAHNAANLKLDKPLLGYLDALSEQERGSNADDGYVQLLQPIILHPIPKPISKRAVITVAPDVKSQDSSLRTHEHSTQNCLVCRKGT